MDLAEQRQIAAQINFDVPRGYLTDLVRSFFAPKAWCALERDSELTQPYVVDEES